jgi:hypothetical protein
MRIEHHPWTYDLEARFPQTRIAFGYEGGYVAAAESDAKFYIVGDERTMADFLLPSDPVDAEVLARLISIAEYESAEERDAELARLVAEHEATRRRMREQRDQ